MSLLALLVVAPALLPCAERAALYEGGRPVGSVCLGEAAARGLTILDLSDGWTPRMLREDPSLGEAGRQPWREEFLALADERTAAPEERDLELHGVSPTLSVLLGRLADDERHLCHAGVDDAPLLALGGDDVDPGMGQGARGPAVVALQEHLACEGLLRAEDVDGKLGGDTARALTAFQRRHRSIASGRLDEEARALLLLPSMERDFRAVLRALRERVADAASLIEDGSARGEPGLVLGRRLDLPSVLGEDLPPLSQGAPDLVSLAADRAARALGLLDPQRARAFLEERLDEERTLVAVRLPPRPSWHRAPMDLRVEIDRGDVAALRAGREGRRPFLVLWARAGEAEVALVRWPTTVGGWQAEKLESGEVVPRFKGSPRGSFVWRELYVAPTWYPPPSTPDAELVRKGRGGRYIASTAGLGPGPFSAYGLAMLIHEEERATKDGEVRYRDTQIRTHGTGAAASVLRGASHGCHRLMSMNAVRLAGFLLAHRPHERVGPVVEHYGRTLFVQGQAVPLSLSDRGTLFVLDPPVPVEVLDGPPPSTTAGR